MHLNSEGSFPAGVRHLASFTTHANEFLMLNIILTCDFTVRNPAEFPLVHQQYLVLLVLQKVKEIDALTW